MVLLRDGKRIIHDRPQTAFMNSHPSANSSRSVLSWLGAIIALCCAWCIGRWALDKNFFAVSAKKVPPVFDSSLRLVPLVELRLADSKNASGVHWLSILGHVFDVSSKPSMYGPQGSYGFFAGRDATRSYATGQFDEEGLQESAEGLGADGCLAIEKWHQFFTKKSEYKLIGYLEESIYMDALTQTPREALVQLRHCAGVGQTASDEATAKAHCNSDWNLQTGVKRYWCGDEYAGAGDMVPRKAAFSHHDGVLRYQCICIPLQEISSRLDVMVYEGCDARSLGCTVRETQ